jgi:uncharacterized protein (DUF362 family)
MSPQALREGLSSDETQSVAGAPTTALVSAVWDEALRYPVGDEYFSPMESFPEYKHEHLSTRPNEVYRAVRSCFELAGLDRENFGSASWNPLGRYIRPGNKVFVLCNFVKHDDQQHGPTRFSAKCTHGSVLRAVLDYALLALQGQGTLAFGNAPIQSCDWPRVLAETGASRVEEFYRSVSPGSLPVQATDLRGHVVRNSMLSGFKEPLHSEKGAYVPVDLANESLLDAFYANGASPHLRVLDYDPRRTAECHARGKHVYLLHRQILESDVVLSIPKLKTHEKVGVTAGIKGCVGAVAHKDCLAHHRRGTPKRRGDEYPDRLSFLEPLSALHDLANLQQPGWRKGLAHCIDVLSRKVVRRFSRALGGSWPGNDTCWRMALDLARIITFADPNGRLHPNPQRQHILLTDGIIAGEGNGPLSPSPVMFGYLALADNIAAGDYVNCLAMGFDPMNIPLIRAALSTGDRALVTGAPPQWDLRLNGRRVSPADLSRVFTRRFAPPREWRALLGAR